MTTKAKPWEFVAVDLIYRDKEPVTIALLPADYPDLEGWMHQHVKRPLPGEPLFFGYTYYVTLH